MAAAFIRFCFTTLLQHHRRSEKLSWLQVRVWDTNSLVCLATLQGHSGAVRALAASPTRVFSGSDDTTIKVFDPPDSGGGRCSIMLGEGKEKF